LHEAGSGAGDDDLRALGGAVNAEKDDADAFADGTDFFLKSLNIKKSPVQACPMR